MEVIITATGQRLAHRLTALIGGLMRNDIPTCEGHAVSALLDKLEAKRRRKTAIAAALELIDTGERASRNAKARRLAAALLKHRRRYRRIQLQHATVSALDEHLEVIHQGAVNWRSLFDEIEVPSSKPDG